jgi:hypothetical protein
MSDIVENLRGAAGVAYSEEICLFLKQRDCAKAAAEIERLRAALEEIVTVARELDDDFPIEARGAIVRAESALKQSV